MTTLYIVATPIGNLEDITFRAIGVLKTADLILCEDTRTTEKLLYHYGIKKQLFSYHQHSNFKKVEYIIKLLQDGKNLALVSEAGTPGVSDPGNKLIEELTARLGFAVKIVPIPGPSALTCAASVSGFPMDKFIFMGFPPTKKKRKKFFQEIAMAKYPVIFYESPYRVIKSLKELSCFLTEQKIVVCRELTKRFETIYRGGIEEIISQIEKDKTRGEFVVLVNK